MPTNPIRKTEEELSHIAMDAIINKHDPHLFHEVYFGGGHIGEPKIRAFLCFHWCHTCNELVDILSLEQEDVAHLIAYIKDILSEYKFEDKFKKD